MSLKASVATVNDPPPAGVVAPLMPAGGRVFHMAPTRFVPRVVAWASTAPPSRPSLPAVGDLATVPREHVPALLVQCAAVQTALAARLVAEAPPSRTAADDRLLTVAEAAKRLHVSADWLYRHARALPFTVRVGPRQLRFSAAGVERYIRQRHG